MTALDDLIGPFAALLVPDPANEEKLRQWIAAARAVDLPTCTPSPAASSSTSGPPPPRSRSRTTTAGRKASTARRKRSSGTCSAVPASNSSGTAFCWD
jgi:hypothetical protein